MLEIFRILLVIGDGMRIFFVLGLFDNKFIMLILNVYLIVFFFVWKSVFRMDGE